MRPSTLVSGAALLILLLHVVSMPRRHVNAQLQDEEEEEEEEEAPNDEEGEYWYEEELDEEELAILQVNATSEEMAFASNVANYLVEVQKLLELLALDEERVRAKGILEHAATTVHNALQLVRSVPNPTETLAECANKHAMKAWADLVDVGRNIDSCNNKWVEQLKGDYNPSEDDVNGDEDEREDDPDDEEVLERDTQFFLKLAIGILKLTPFQEAEIAAELAEMGPLSEPIAQHGRMLIKRGRRMSRIAKRCIALQLGEAYSRADQAADSIHECLAALALSHQEL